MNQITLKRDRDGLAALPLRVNRLLPDLFDLRAATAPTPDGWMPRMDVYETPEAIEVHADIPGIDPQSVDVSIVKDRLDITGTREARTTPENTRWYRFERPLGAFRRSVRLPVRVDADRAVASSEHGQLHIVLPKVAEVMPKRIAIKGE